jgi:hypothetical protein
MPKSLPTGASGHPHGLAQTREGVTSAGNFPRSAGHQELSSATAGAIRTLI